MDGLPVREATGVPSASTDTVKDMAGKDQPAMHACAHDSHVTALIGSARILVSLRDRWTGTLVLVAQPAEEVEVPLWGGVPEGRGAGLRG